LAALQQHDDDQKKTNNHMNGRNQNKHAAPVSVESAQSEKTWCGRGDLNPHAFRRHPLKMVCLPVPPLPQIEASVDYSKGFQYLMMAAKDFGSRLAPPTRAPSISSSAINALTFS